MDQSSTGYFKKSVQKENYHPESKMIEIKGNNDILYHIEQLER